MIPTQSLDVDDDGFVWLTTDWSEVEDATRLERRRLGHISSLDLDDVPDALHEEAMALIDGHDCSDVRGDDARNFYAGLGDPRRW